MDIVAPRHSDLYSLDGVSYSLTEGPRVRVIAYTINKHIASRTLELDVISSQKIRLPVESLLYRKLAKANSFGKNLVILVDGYAIRILH